MRTKNSIKSALNIASSEFVIQISVFFSFSFFFLTTIQCSWLPSLQRHSLFLYSFFFECPTLRLLAGLVDDWQITFKKFLDVRCAECNGFYRISSLWQSWCSLFWSAAIDWCLCIFFLIIFHCFNIAWSHNK